MSYFVQKKNFSFTESLTYCRRELKRANQQNQNRFNFLFLSVLLCGNKNENILKKSFFILLKLVCKEYLKKS